MKIRKTLGFVILGISILLWLAIAVIPFLGFKGGQTAGLMVGLVIAGEVTFYLAIALLGKEIWMKIKGFFKKKKRESDKETDQSPDQDQTIEPHIS